MSNWFMHPLEELSHLRHTLDETLKGWTTPFAANPSLDWGWKPRMDICENRSYFKILLELPGFSKEDLDVQVNGRFLSIKGSKQEYKDSEWKFHRRERYSGGEFHRAVALPEGIDGSSIQAKFQGGVLSLTIPKSGGKNTQHISLLGLEEHGSRNFVIQQEEEERRRRMEENDPHLSRTAWAAGRIGTVIDEERERQRRIKEIDHFYKKASMESLRLTQMAETKERARRIKDTKGESDKKRIARRVSTFIKPLGANPKSRLTKISPMYNQKKSYSTFKNNSFQTFNKGSVFQGFQGKFQNGSPYSYPGFGRSRVISHLEEKERQRRISDKKVQQLQKVLAKRVSSMILNANGLKSLKHNSQYSDVVKINSGNKNNFYQYNDNVSFNFKVRSNSKNLEEKERQRRIADKKKQQQDLALAKKVSNMIKGSSGVLNLKHTYNNNKNSFFNIEKERQKRLIDMIGNATF
ncbi:heat shock protein Hsp20 domain-containing protein [Tieghemostelium lacteum]|uniref:Heat shock protein Hsp20 domain-containing protein n=1 Tax=Tieghemostelium lacteum TaxID=361077 RepID=A0A151Z4K2_TIELA|nr:heat shock protein Hsp20 domain-containing protein [Tieghemostelium lacteum]|eukprot:KYQ88847.1 heat shock protein Hsp20 domain-containing protein [Tieghemostelium lacteum]